MNQFARRNDQVRFAPLKANRSRMTSSRYYEMWFPIKSTIEMGPRADGSYTSCPSHFSMVGSQATASGSADVLEDCCKRNCLVSMRVCIFN